MLELELQTKETYWFTQSLFCVRAWMNMFVCKCVWVIRFFFISTDHDNHHYVHIACLSNKKETSKIASNRYPLRPFSLYFKLKPICTIFLYICVYFNNSTIDMIMWYIFRLVNNLIWVHLVHIRRISHLLYWLHIEIIMKYLKFFLKEVQTIFFYHNYDISFVVFSSSQEIKSLNLMMFVVIVKNVLYIIKKIV